MAKEEKGKDRSNKKAPQKGLKEKRADKVKKRNDKTRKGLDDLKVK